MSTYVYENGLFQIDDSALGIHFSERVLQSSEETSSRHDGTVMMRSLYQEGLLHGPSYSFFQNGVMASERWFYNGLPHGRSLFFSSSGKIVAKKGYRNGLLSGPYVLYYPSGQVRLSASYLDGFPHGTFLLVCEDGKHLRYVSFVKGRRSGFDTGWTDDGYPLFCELWQNGVKLRSVLPDPLSRNIE